MGTSRGHAGRVWAASAAAAMLLAAGQPAAMGQVEWKTGRMEAPAPMAGAALRDELGALSASGSHGLALFDRPVTEAERATLAEAGVRLLAPVSGRAYFVSVDADARPALAVGAAALSSVGPIELDWKWHPVFARGQVPTWVVVEDRPADPVVAVYAVFHRDVDLDAGIDAAGGVGATVMSALESVNGAVIEIPHSRVADLAALDDVQWVEPALPPLSTTNAENRAITQVDEVQAAPYELDGSGVTVLVYDGGAANPNHDDFGDRMTVIDNAGLSDHATHVSGTIGGDGTVIQNNRGMAPNVAILSAGFQWTSDDIFLYEDPGDIEEDYETAVLMGASLANNSIGSNTEFNGFPCEIQGDYGVTASVIDSVVRGEFGEFGEPIIVVWANGNERGGSGCDVEGYGDYYSIAPPAGAKNHITVGALNANDDSMTSFSSWGPTDDGRMKPDVSAPGCQSNGDGGVTSTSSSGGYNVKCGTSMASPTVCGISALILEDFRAQFPDRDDPRASTMKAILAHTAEDLGNPGPDYQFGYGSVRVKDAIDFMRTEQFVEQEILQGGQHTFDVEVEPGAPELRFTLAWDDAPATPNIDIALVNQLDLRVIDPDGNTHHPWTLDQFNPGDPAVRTGPNTRDNIEQVFVEDPEAGTWTVVVEGTEVPEGPQRYSIAGTPNLNVSLLSIGLESEVPDLLVPGTPLELEVSITTINETLVEGSEKLFYRFDSGSFTEVSLEQDGDTYVATVPGSGCDTMPEFYVAAEGVENGVLFNPSAGPDGPYAYGIGEIATLLEDEMESDSGWTAGLGSDTAVTGQWERGDPIGTADGDELAQPEDDHTPDGTDCYFTGQGSQGGTVGENDVDGGFTTLVSPAFDLSGTVEAEMSYWRWYSNYAGAGAHSDVFVIDISNDGGETWTNLETVGPTGSDTIGGWIKHTFVVEDVIEPTDEIVLRFIAEDDPSDGQGAVVEAAIDDLKVEHFVCESDCYADFNGDGDLSILDFVAFQTAFQNGDDAADCDGSGTLDVVDFVCFQGEFQAGCG